MPSRKPSNKKGAKKPTASVPALRKAVADVVSKADPKAKREAFQRAAVALAIRQDRKTYRENGLVLREDAQKLFNKGQPIPQVKVRDDARFLADGWTNVISGLGHRNDKQHRTHFGAFQLILDVELQQMYMGDGLITRIVDCPAEDMTREWIDLEGDEEDEELAKEQMEAVSEVLEELDTEVAFNTALKWKRLYGGALIVMGILDGKTPDMPVDFNRIRGMSSLARGGSRGHSHLEQHLRHRRRVADLRAAPRLRRHLPHRRDARGAVRACLPLHPVLRQARAAEPRLPDEHGAPVLGAVGDPVRLRQGARLRDDHRERGQHRQRSS